MDSEKGFTRVGVIMAGGAGERFWPLSRHEHPKQLLRLTSDTESMLAEAVSRLAPLIPPERIYIATAEHLIDAVREAQVGVPEENILGEPCKRNTAGCLVFATAHVLARHDGDGSKLSMAVVTADHLIGDAERFRQTVAVSLDAAEIHGVLTTQGIVPSRPETGYGYIQALETEGPVLESKGIPVYTVAAFHEKPNKEMAENFIDSGHYYWNSGMFFWQVETFLSELRKVRPKMAQAAHDMAAAILANDKGTVRTIFESFEDISIDYALMEHSEHVAVARADYPWDDVGVWSALDRTRPRDEHGNVMEGEPVVVDCQDCIIYNDVGPERMAVSVVGVEGLVVVVSEDGVLVIPKDRAQDVRHAVSELKARGAKQV